MSRSVRASIASRAAIVWLTAAPLTAALAQPQAEPPPPNPDELAASENPWRFEAYVWGWMSGMNGDIGAGGATVAISESFLDLVEASDSVVAFSGRLEFGYERFGGYVDGLYSDLTIEDQSGPLGLASVDIESEQTILDFGFTYRLGDWEPTGEAAKNPRNRTLDLYAGGRYSKVEVTIDPAALPSFGDDKEWLDPIIGAKFVVPFAEHWHAELNGDIGGFGVESDFTWSATAVIGYDFHIFKAPASVLLGYRAMGWDFSEGSGTSEFTWDLIQHGPLLGLSIRF